MIHIFTLLAFLVSNSAHAGHCPGNTVRVTFEDANGHEVTGCRRAPSLSISVGSHDHHSPRTSYRDGSGHYRSVPWKYEGRVSTPTTGQSPDYWRALESTYAWRLMNKSVQEARMEADANAEAAKRAVSAETALAQERAAYKVMEAEYAAYYEEHHVVDSDDSATADEADKEVK